VRVPTVFEPLLLVVPVLLCVPAVLAHDAMMVSMVANVCGPTYP
jgi:hypothetical protein